MEFANEAQRTTYDLVGAYMAELVDGEPLRHPESPMFGIVQGSAEVTIAVIARGDTALVLVQSYVVTQVEPSFELFEYLLKANHDLYPAFSVDEENDVALSVLLFGETLDQEELSLAVQAVAETADEHDDEIIARFGGLSAADRSG